MRKKIKNYKPYWTQDLTRLWRDMIKSEKEFLKGPKTSTNRSVLRACFQQKQFVFDKALRNAERAHNRRFADEIEERNTSDPQMFWGYINRFRPKKQKNIPLKAYDNYNNLSDDSDIALQKWRDDFQGLYDIPDTETDVFDNGFWLEKLHEKNMLETGYHAVDHSDSPNGYGYDYLNMPIFSRRIDQSLWQN